jgi:uncharacterized protein (DUF433 family)
MDRIVRTPGVCGGRARFEGTRLSVWLVVALIQEGYSYREISRAYPRLTMQDVEDAHDYALEYPEEISRDIIDQRGA